MPEKKTNKRGKKRGSGKTVRRAPKRTVAKKVPVKREATKKSVAATRSARPLAKNRITMVVKNLILFAILFVLSVIIASVSTNEMVDQLFWILAILTGFVAVALLIVLLVFLFMRAMKK